jgi:trk system potassium uptake protein TrkH
MADRGNQRFSFQPGGLLRTSLAPPAGPSRLESRLAPIAPVLLLGVLAAAAAGVAERSIAGFVALGLAVALFGASLYREIREHDLRGVWRWVVFGLVALTWDRPLSLAGIVAIRQVVVAFGTFGRHTMGRRFGNYLWSHPVEFLALGFAGMIAAGTLLLMLPAASVLPQGLGAADALFTATSATCVTGLTVVDTATAFTPLGQGIIAVLIQVGGLGVMALSTLAAVVVGRGLAQAQSGAVAASMETTRPVDAVQLVRVVVAVTFATEAFGALVLTLAVLPDMPVASAIGYGVFHAVSAFCNAGFALWSDSLMGTAGSLPVLVTVSLLIVLGGLGFLVLAELGPWLVSRARRRRPMSLHARVVLGMSASLILAGAVLFALLEWHGALAGLEGSWKPINAVFMSISTRTAGFNSVPMGGFQGATLLLVTILMLIGASPGSTGGGIKTTTATVILYAARAFVRGREDVEVGGRTLPRGTVLRAIVLAFLAVAVVTVGFFLLLLTQTIPFDSLLFESISAFATVGLSVGATGELDTVGKLVVVGLMYVGRVGPLTLILLLGGSGRVTARLPEEPMALT